MKDIRQDSITKRLKDLRDIIVPLVTELDREDVSYELVAGKLGSLQQRIVNATRDAENIEQKNKMAVTQAMEVVEKARKEAEEIKNRAIDRNVHSIRLFEKLKDRLEAEEKRRIREEMKDLDKKETVEV